MKYVKILGLLAVAATALMAFASAASATTVEAPEGTKYTGAISATNEGGLTLHGVVDVTCNKSTVNGTVETHGSGVTAKGPITGLTFTECTQHVKVIKGGTLEVHYIAGSGTQGTVTSSGAEVTVEFTTIFGNVHCIFGTNNTHVGTFTSAPNATGHAQIHVSSSKIPVKEGSGLCGSSAEWTGTYKVVSPTGLKLNP